MKLVNGDNGQILAAHLLEANTFWKRLKGLMFTKELSSGSGLHIRPCQGVHTFFMNYSIDVIHLDSNQQVVFLEENLPPGRVGKLNKQTLSIVELPAGTIQGTATKVGHKLRFFY